MAEKSIIKEAQDIRLAMELISLGARLQMLESETQISRGRLIRLYKELRGCPPPKGMLPFSTDWFMTWEQNIHASMFYNAYEFLMNSGQCTGVDVIVKAYRLYLEQCPPAPGEEPRLDTGAFCGERNASALGLQLLQRVICHLRAHP